MSDSEVKIAVYAITRDEEKLAERFAKSCVEADGVFVLDMGSKDKTVDILRANNVVVKQEPVEPFSCKIAKNLALQMIPDNFDWCLALDLDDALIPGWRQKLKPFLLNEQFNRGYYKILPSRAWVDNVHRRRTHTWINNSYGLLQPRDGVTEKKFVSNSFSVERLNYHESELKPKPGVTLNLKPGDQIEVNIPVLGKRIATVADDGGLYIIS